MTASKKFYDRLAFLYPAIDLLLRPQKVRFFRIINSYPHGRLLEIGVGNGRHLKHYTTHDIVGVDTSESMLASAKRYGKDNIRILRMNGEALAFPGEAFDYVVLSHLIAVVENPEKVLTEVFRVLKPGGKLFILNHFTPDNWLRYADRSVAMIARLLHFRSVFHISDLATAGKFKLLRSFHTDPFSYFKILIYEKERV